MCISCDVENLESWLALESGEELEHLLVLIGEQTSIKTICPLYC